LQNYGLIGWIAAGIAIACIGLAARSGEISQERTLLAKRLALEGDRSSGRLA
jgi:hypothetical protein